jgi:hypothetical protein
MRHAEISTKELARKLRTVTLHVADEAEWYRLGKLRGTYDPTEIIGCRDLGPEGWSVDVLCSRRDDAQQMIGDWCFGRWKKAA